MKDEMKKILEAALDAACQQYDDCVNQHGKNDPLCIALSAIKAARQQALEEYCQGNEVYSVSWMLFSEVILKAVNILSSLRKLNLLNKKGRNEQEENKT